MAVIIAVGLFFAGLVLSFYIHFFFLPLLWGGGFAYGIYRVVSDSGKSIMAFRSVATSCSLSIEGDARLPALLQAQGYQPRIWGRYRDVNLAVRVSNITTEENLDGTYHLALIDVLAIGSPGNTLRNARKLRPLTVFEASLQEDAPPARPGNQQARNNKIDTPSPSDLALKAFDEIQQVRRDARMRGDIVAFFVQGELNDSDEIMENIELLVDCLLDAREASPVE